MASSMVRPESESEGIPDGTAGTWLVEVPIHSDRDVIEARRHGRSVAERQGFSPVEVTLITTAISEVARNIVVHAGHGQVAVDVVEVQGRRAVQVTARDEGPGIPDVDLAMTDGYSTRRGLGLGLPGVRRLMDEVELHSTAGGGTTVVLRKWQGTTTTRLSDLRPGPPTGPPPDREPDGG